MSRDFLEIAHANNFDLIDYYARSSFASIGSPAITDENLISKIESKFQRSMIARDLNKSIFKSLEKNNFDLILIDLIDERFNLAEYNGSICTISTEFKKYQNKKYKTIPFDSEEKFNLWKKGVEALFYKIEDEKISNKIIVSKLFWAEKNEKNINFSEETKSFILRNNRLLEKMYNFISKFINKNQFINYPENLIISAENHKWGVEPFHYIDELYHHTHKSLEEKLKLFSSQDQN